MDESVFDTLLIAFSIGIVIVSSLIRQKARHEFASQLNTDWQNNGRSIQFAPIYAGYLGYRPVPDHHALKPQHGALGIVDHTLSYAARDKMSDLTIPLDAIEWMGSHRIMVETGKNAVQKMALVVHYQQPTFDYSISNEPNGSLWRVAAFITAQNHDILTRLSQLTGLKYVALPRSRYDFGPFDATRMQQDIYGQWEGTVRRPLYLAPDRLLFDFRHAIHLRNLRTIEVVTREHKLISLPGSESLLRLTYLDHTGNQQMIAYLLRYAPAMAEALSVRSGIPFSSSDGRKKK